MANVFIRAACGAVLCAGLLAPVAAQIRQSAPANAAVVVAAVDPVLPKSYVIGIGDVLAVKFWRDDKMSGEVVVRPDGRISLPLLNDVDAARQTPEQLAGTLAKAAEKYMSETDVTVVVKEIHSRRVFLVGEVASPGMVNLTGDMNVLQLIAVGGGLHEYADKANIVIIRVESGQEKRFKFNYNDVLKGKNTKQNILLQPGDTIVVR